MQRFHEVPQNGANQILRIKRKGRQSRGENVQVQEAHVQRMRGMKSLSDRKNHGCVAQLGHQGLLMVERVETTEINKNIQAKKLELHLLSYEESLGDLVLGSEVITILDLERQRRSSVKDESKGIET